MSDNFWDSPRRCCWRRRRRWRWRCAAWRRRRRRGGGKRASDVAVFEEVSRIVREGGAESLLARGRAAKGSRVVPVTERANVRFTSA